MILGRRLIKQRCLVFRETWRGLSEYPNPELKLPNLNLDLEFYLNPENTALIKQNIKSRNCTTDIDKVINLSKLNPTAEVLMKELLDIPNMSSSKVRDLTEPRLVFQRDFIPPEFKIRNFEEISRILGGGRIQNLAHFSGERTYYLTGLN